MVTFAQLRAARPEQWLEAGDEWRARAETALGHARTLKSQRDATRAAWGDSQAGKQAVDRLTYLVNQLLIISAEHRAVAMVSKGLGHAVKICQDSLLRAVHIAETAGLRMDEAGAVSAPPAGVPTDRVASFDSAYRNATFLIDAAIDAVCRADRAAHDGLSALADAASQRDLTRALDEDLARASRLEMTMISAILPDGNAGQNAVWWDSLTPEDRELLKRAAAAELEDLSGIPVEVKKELRGSGSYDRANAADWAEEHWNDRSDDIFDNNWTNFASNAVHFGGGVGYRIGAVGTLDDDTWEKTASRGNS